MNRLEVGDYAVLGGPIVIGRGHQQSVGAVLSRRAHHRHRVRRIVGADPGNELDVWAYRAAHGLQQLSFFIQVRGGSFPRGAGNQDGVAAVVHQVLRQAGGGLVIHRAVRVERSHHCY